MDVRRITVADRVGSHSTGVYHTGGCRDAGSSCCLGGARAAGGPWVTNAGDEILTGSRQRVCTRERGRAEWERRLGSGCERNVYRVDPHRGLDGSSWALWEQFSKFESGFLVPARNGIMLERDNRYHSW